MEAPADLRKALASHAKASAQWKTLTSIGRRDFITWITSAKQAETRVRRIKVALDKLAKGQRRPCCYAVVPMELYKTLATLPKAKEQWKTLSPDEKRDFNDWVSSAKDKEDRMKRVEKTCALLLSGRRRP